MARRRIGLRAFPRQQRLNVKTDGESAFRRFTTSIDEVIFRSAAGYDSHGRRAVTEYMMAIGVARPAMAAKILAAILVQEAYEECRANGRPIPPGLRRR